jgi:hypothetical protein
LKLTVHYRPIIRRYQRGNEQMNIRSNKMDEIVVVVTKQFQGKLRQKQHQNEQGTNAVFKQYLRDRSKQKEDEVIVYV